MEASSDLPGFMISFMDAGIRSELIFGKREILLPKVAVYHNVAQYSENFARHLDHEVYVARRAEVNPINLVDLPNGTTVHGDLQYLTTCGDAVIHEQCHPDVRNDAAHLSRAFSSQLPLVEIDDCCLLVARFGEWTWGHWLGELLPRAVAAESVAPGKYRYIVPFETTNPASDHPLTRNVLGSLQAYGIADNRLLRIGRTHRYRFRNLSAVTSVWSYPYVMHPAANIMMRTGLHEPVPSVPDSAKSAAFLRIEGTGRTIQNAPEVMDLLKSKGFSLFQIGHLPFLEQVAIFQQARDVFGVLGSSIAGLIYSPNGVRVLSVAPGAWGDRFFYALIQGRCGKYADIRGEPDPASGGEMWAPFSLSLAQISKGLELLRESN